MMYVFIKMDRFIYNNSGIGEYGQSKFWSLKLGVI